MTMCADEHVHNPGSLTGLSEKCTNLFPAFFDGFQIIIHRHLSQHFSTTHNIYLSSITPGNYRYEVTYAQRDDFGDDTVLMYGDIDSHGSINANFFRAFGYRFRVRFDSQMECGKFVTSQLATHYYGDTFTASAILMNADLLKRRGGLLLHYLQNLTPNFAIGAELALTRRMSMYKMSPRKEPTCKQLSIVARYSTDRSIWSAIVSPTNFVISCYKRTSDQVEFGLEVDTNYRTNISVGSLAYQISLPQRGILFKALVDTNTNVGSVFEKKVSGSPFSFSVSANLNHTTNNFRLGLGVTVE